MARRKIGRRRTQAELDLARRKALAARKYHLKTKHHMTLEQYAELLAFQGGVCYTCRRANGRTKALAVEHDHKIAREVCAFDPRFPHPEDESCYRCWRGLACGPCNDTHAHSRDTVAFHYRCIDYLTDPPARRWLRGEEGDDAR